MLQIGDHAPDFSVPDADMEMFKLSRLRGKTVVLYFYPKDDTPGCTVEACEFRDNLPKFKKMNAKVYGVSKDSLKSHAKFADKYELPFTLVSDEDGKMCEAFDTWVEKSMYGKTSMGIERATFLADDKGVIRQIWRKVKAAGHAEEVLAEIKKLK